MKRNEFFTLEFLEVLEKALHHRQGQLERMMRGHECHVCRYMLRKVSGGSVVRCNMCPIERECGGYLEAMGRVDDVLDSMWRELDRALLGTQPPQPQTEEKPNNFEEAQNDSE